MTNSNNAISLGIVGEWISDREISPLHVCIVWLWQTLILNYLPHNLKTDMFYPMRMEFYLYFRHE